MVYNLEVEDFHTYFVGEYGALVHNSCLGDDGEWHHIASDKSIKTGYTAKYKEIFDKGGVGFDEEINKIFLKGHKGRHTNNYKDDVLSRLTNAIKELEAKGGTPTKEVYRQEIQKVLEEIKAILNSNPRYPYE